MKQKFLLKTMLLLCALVVGSGTMWATNVAVNDILWTEPFTGTNTSTNFSATSSSGWGDYTNPTTFVSSDATQLTYSSSNAMLNSSTANNMTGAHVWLKKSTDGVYFQVEGIKLYDASKVKVSWAQTGASKVTVAYAFDDDDTFTDLSNNSTATSEFVSDELDVSGHTTIHLKFHRTSTSTNIRIDNLTLKVTEAAPSFTITPQTNNSDYGTVSLSGKVITASPNTGYRVRTTTPYTVDPANSATVSQNGNIFTVTPSQNTTVTIYFESIPSRTLTANVTPDGSGSVALGATSVLEGATTTATASANAGYKFTGWCLVSFYCVSLQATITMRRLQHRELWVVVDLSWICGGLRTFNTYI